MLTAYLSAYYSVSVQGNIRCLLYTSTVTIDRFMQNNLNIAETARQLHMHRNTLIYRLEQVEKRTCLDLRRFEDAMTYKIASMVLNYLQTERNSQT